MGLVWCADNNHPHACIPGTRTMHPQSVWVGATVSQHTTTLHLSTWCGPPRVCSDKAKQGPPHLHSLGEKQPLQALSSRLACHQAKTLCLLSSHRYTPHTCTSKACVRLTHSLQQASATPPATWGAVMILCVICACPHRPHHSQTSVHASNLNKPSSTRTLHSSTPANRLQDCAPKPAQHTFDLHALLAEIGYHTIFTHQSTGVTPGRVTFL